MHFFHVFLSMLEKMHRMRTSDSALLRFNFGTTKQRLEWRLGDLCMLPSVEIVRQEA
jgi:hypothetical protein